MITLKQIKNLKNQSFYIEGKKLKEKLKDITVSGKQKILRFLPVFITVNFITLNSIVPLDLLSQSLVDKDGISLFFFTCVTLIFLAIANGLGALIQIILNSIINIFSNFKKLEDISTLDIIHFLKIKKVFNLAKDIKKEDKNTLEYIRLTKNSPNYSGDIFRLIDSHIYSYCHETIIKEKNEIIEIIQKELSNTEQCYILKRLESIIKIQSDNDPKKLIESIKNIENDAMKKFKIKNNIVIKDI